MSEAAFNALIALKPALSSANWTSNKPNLDQSLFDTLNISGCKFFVDEIRIGTTYEDVTGGAPDPSAPDVDAGNDWITWSGQAVQLDPNVFNNDPCDPQSNLTYAWSADPNGTDEPDIDVVFSDPNAEDPNVTITKAPGDMDTVTLTLAVTDVHNPTPVKGTVTIDVYDDACQAARIGKWRLADNPTDCDGNCITNLKDFAVLAAWWLDEQLWP